MKCPICGHKATLNESICSHCGYRFDESETKKEQNKTPKIKKAYNVYKKVRLIRNSIIFIVIICGAIPVMMNAFKSNIDNHIHNYGGYTLAEFEAMNIEADTLNVLKQYIDTYDQYLSDSPFIIEAKPTVYYLSSGTTSSLTYYIKYKDNNMYYNIELTFNENDLETTSFRISNSYKGNLCESFQHINKKDLTFLAELIEVDDLYQSFEETFNKLQLTDEIFVTAEKQYDDYYIKIHEQQYDDIITSDYIMTK